MNKYGFEIVRGHFPILLVASHNYPHFREGEIKVADLGTGDLVKSLCKELGVWGLVTTQIIRDPNWYPDSLFRKEVKKMIKDKIIQVVIDVHGRKLDSPDLIQFLPNKTFKERYNSILIGKVIMELIENDQLTLTEDLDEADIACVELEIRRDGRVSEENSKNYVKCRELLKLLIQDLKTD